jgi:hypothetical protein
MCSLRTHGIWTMRNLRHILRRRVCSHRVRLGWAVINPSERLGTIRWPAMAIVGCVLTSLACGETKILTPTNLWASGGRVPRCSRASRRRLCDPGETGRLRIEREVAYFAAQNSHSTSLVWVDETDEKAQGIISGPGLEGWPIDANTVCSGQLNRPVFRTATGAIPPDEADRECQIVAPVGSQFEVRAIGEVAGQPDEAVTRS